MARSAKSAKTDDGRLDPLAEIVLLGAGGFGAMTMILLIPALPLITRSFAGDPTADFLIPWLVSGPAGASILAALSTGALINRFGRRPLLLGGLAMFTIAGLLGQWLPSLPAIVVSRVVAAGAGSLAGITCFSLIGDLSSGSGREHRIGLAHAVAGSAAIVIMPAAGMLADIDWRLVFLVHLIGLPMLACAYFSPSLRTVDARISARLGEDRTKGGRLPPAVIPLIVLSLLGGLVGYTTHVYLPFRLKDLGVYSGTVASLMFVAGSIPATASALVYGHLRRWLSTSTMFLIVFGGMLAGLLVIATVASFTAVIAAVVLFGLAFGLLNPNLLSMVTAVTDERTRPAGVGIVKAMHASGPLVGPLVIQLAFLRYGATGAMTALAAVCTVALVGWIGLQAVQRTQAARAA